MLTGLRAAERLALFSLEGIVHENRTPQSLFSRLFKVGMKAIPRKQYSIVQLVP